MTMRMLINGTPFDVDVLERRRDAVTFRVSERTYRVEFESRLQANLQQAVPAGAAQARHGPVAARGPQSAVGAGSAFTPIPGVVVEVLVQPGQAVVVGQVLVRVEAMKMQNNVFAPVAGIVQSIAVIPGQEVRDGDLLLELRPD